MPIKQQPTVKEIFQAHAEALKAKGDTVQVQGKYPSLQSIRDKYGDFPATRQGRVALIAAQKREKK